MTLCILTAQNEHNSLFPNHVYLLKVPSRENGTGRRLTRVDRMLMPTGWVSSCVSVTYVPCLMASYTACVARSGLEVSRSGLAAPLYTLIEHSNRQHSEAAQKIQLAQIDPVCWTRMVPPMC